MKTYTLTLGKGKNKREWRLSEREFREFEFRFEERELIDISEWDSLANLTLVKVDVPK